MFDEVAAAIERVLKAAQGTGAKGTKRMTRSELVAHALSELTKAAAEPRARALHRLAVLGKAVEVAKQSFVDTESETIQVPIFEEETTASADETESEMSPVALEAGLSNAAFASNPEDLHKALGDLRKQLERLRASTSKGDRSTPAKGTTPTDGRWPLDMNTKDFREDVRKGEGGPTWGYDPGFESEAASRR
jgi:hypothetical protein